jgi:hypothetical protein
MIMNRRQSIIGVFGAFIAWLFGRSAPAGMKEPPSESKCIADICKTIQLTLEEAIKTGQHKVYGMPVMCVLVTNPDAAMSELLKNGQLTINLRASIHQPIDLSQSRYVAEGA